MNGLDPSVELQLQSSSARMVDCADLDLGGHREVVDWERKNEIAGVDLAQTQNLVRHMSRLANSANCWRYFQ